MFLGTDRIFTRRKERSREFEEGFSEKNKDVRVCIKTRKVCIVHLLVTRTEQCHLHLPQCLL